MNLRKKFYEKISLEYDKYEEELKTHDVNYVIQHSYETVIKDEIVRQFDPDYSEYDINKIKILNNLKNPLNEIYCDWLDCEFDINSDLNQCINDFADYVKRIKQIKER
ncbi:MAG: DUF3848 domain-containing protein [Firmicutes bacterium]|nr:DUF3848 domain-containing protein [Bacillota bacterium]